MCLCGVVYIVNFSVMRIYFVECGVLYIIYGEHYSV